MKLLLTENRLNDLIKDTLMREFPSIYTVNFKTIPNIVLPRNLRVEKTFIQIYLLPENLIEVPSGSYLNLNFEAIARQQKKEIYKFIKSHFPVDTEEFSSDWGINFFYLKPELI